MDLWERGSALPTGSLSFWKRNHAVVEYPVLAMETGSARKSRQKKILSVPQKSSLKCLKDVLAEELFRTNPIDVKDLDARLLDAFQNILQFKSIRRNYTTRKISSRVVENWSEGHANEFLRKDNRSFEDNILLFSRTSEGRGMKNSNMKFDRFRGGVMKL